MDARLHTLVYDLTRHIQLGESDPAYPPNPDLDRCQLAASHADARSILTLHDTTISRWPDTPPGTSNVVGAWQVVRWFDQALVNKGVSTSPCTNGGNKR